MVGDGDGVDGGEVVGEGGPGAIVEEKRSRGYTIELSRKNLKKLPHRQCAGRRFQAEPEKILQTFSNLRNKDFVDRVILGLQDMNL